MTKNTKLITRGAIIAAMYFTLTHLQNLLLPGSTTWAIQCRISEALCVLAFFTPAAIWGLTVGCLLFNLSYAGALPLDPIVGSLATLLATWCMWKLRNFKQFKLPILGLLMPAAWNAILVGWELTVYLGDTGFTMAAFWINAAYVALGELIVLCVLGSILYFALIRRDLYKKLL